MSRTRRIVSAITLVCALYVLALSLFSRTRDAETLSDYYRPYMSDAGIRVLRANLRVVNAAGAELRDVVLPQLQRELDVTEAREAMFPALGRLTLSQARFMHEFHNPDATPYRALPWIVIVPGAALLGAGIYGVVVTRRRSVVDSPA